MLRLYFLFHRELLSEFARLAYETVREMMVAAVDEPDARPGMVAVIQTFGSSLKWNPYLHAIVTRSLGLHRLVCYLMRPPVNLSRLRYHPDSKLLLYDPNSGQPVDDDDLLVDPLEFLARVLIHIPVPKKHLVRFYGVYANRIRETFRAEDTALAEADGEASQATSRRSLSRRWAEPIYRVYEVDSTFDSQPSITTSGRRAICHQPATLPTSELRSAP